ncbi:MAG: DUF7453 family protein [Phycisphaerales bacterium]
MTLASAASGQLLYAKTVAARGGPAPAGVANVNFQNFYEAVLSRTGVVFNRIDLSGTGTSGTTNLGIYSGTGPFDLVQVGREGSTAAGIGAGVNYSTFGQMGINGSGTVSFVSTIIGAGVTAANNQGVWAGPPGAPALVALKGQAAPDTGGALFNGFSGLALNGSGEVAFQSSLTGLGVPTSADTGLWANTGGTMTLIAREGSQAPGMPAGANFTNWNDATSGATSLILSDTGAVLFYGTTTGGGVVAGTNDTAIWTGTPGNLAIVIRDGAPAPAGFPNAATVSAINSSGDLSAAGHVAYDVTVTGGGVTAANNRAIMAGLPASVAMVVRNGTAAPNAPAGANFSAFTTAGNKLQINSSGAVLFQATLSGGGVVAANNVGLYTNHGGTMREVHRKGTSPAVLPAGVNITTFDAFAFNSAGQVAFTATLTGTGVVAANNNALFFWDPVLGLRLVAREGDPIHIGGGATATVSASGLLDSSATTPSFIGNATGNGLASSLSDNGALLFTVITTDGSMRLLLTLPGVTYCSRADVASLGGAPQPDGLLTADDVILFLSSFFAGNVAIGDIAGLGGSSSPDGQLTADDVVVFLASFFAGCV